MQEEEERGRWRFYLALFSVAMLSVVGLFCSFVGLFWIYEGSLIRFFCCQQGSLIRLFRGALLALFSVATPSVAVN